jgi:hypothetical protein
MIIDGSTGLEFPDGSDQTTAVPAPGTAGNVLQSNGTIWTSVANPPAFVSGTLMLFQQTSAPTGWTKQTTHNNKALRVVSGVAGSGGTVAFTTAFASQAVNGSIANTTAGGSVSITGGSVGSYTLSTSEIPSHNHQSTNRAANFGGSTFYVLGNGDGGAPTLGTSNTGGGGGHSHSFSAPSGSFSGTAHNHSFTGTAIDLAVSYVDLIIASKD